MGTAIEINIGTAGGINCSRPVANGLSVPALVAVGGAGGKLLQALLAANWRPLALLVTLLLGWGLTASSGLVRPYLLPSPQNVLAAFLGEWCLLWKHTFVTFYEALLGFVLSVLLGLIAALFIVYSPTIEKTLAPILLFAQVVPKIAIAPLFVVWFGFGATAKILVAVLIAFFPVVISAVAGFRGVDPDLLEVPATMGATRWQTFRKILVPACLPQLFSGLKVSATLAVVGAVVGEFVGANEGLGYLVLIANGNLDSPLLFASMISMSGIGVLLYATLALAERLILPWHASQRNSLSFVC